MRAAVIPIKLLTDVKSRLSDCCSPRQREALCLRMLGHLILALRESGTLDEIFVITPDGRVRRFLQRHFPMVRVLLDLRRLSLNDSAAFAGRLLARRGFDSMLFLLGDLPTLTSMEIREVMQLAKSKSVVLIPDRRREGTNALLLSPPDSLQPLFGTHSFERHLHLLRHASKPFAIYESSGFGWDVDTPADLYALCQHPLVLQRTWLADQLKNCNL